MVLFVCCAPIGALIGRSSAIFVRTSSREGVKKIMVDIIKAVEADYLKEQTAPLLIGDYVRVHFKVIEGTRERIQVFEGTVIGRRGTGLCETFTVRRISYGVGVERVFPVHSPKIAKIETVRHGKVRRAKLYYLRGRVGKAAKITEKLD